MFSLVSSPLQLLIEAYDDAFPNYVGQLRLTVNMLRNQNAPVLTGPYTGRINENTVAGDLIVNASATDGDGVRMAFLFLMTVLLDDGKRRWVEGGGGGGQCHDGPDFPQSDHRSD